jgi:hypothetical protein
MSSIRFILIIVSSTAIPLTSFADIWKCGLTYTNITEDKQDCSIMEGSLICGSDGNRYITPSKEGISFKICDRPKSTTADSTSPIVNLKFVEDYKKHKPEQPIKSKRINPSSSNLPFDIDQISSEMNQDTKTADTEELKKTLSDPRIGDLMSDFVLSEKGYKCLAETLFKEGDLSDCGLKSADSLSK